MKKYTSPTINQYGKSENLIKGECGWGSEDWTFDKTGYKEYQVYDWVDLAGEGPYCTTVTKCDTSKPANGCNCPGKELWNC